MSGIVMVWFVRSWPAPPWLASITTMAAGLACAWAEAKRSVAARRLRRCILRLRLINWRLDPGVEVVFD